MEVLNGAKATVASVNQSSQIFVQERFENPRIDITTLSGSMDPNQAIALSVANGGTATIVSASNEAAIFVDGLNSIVSTETLSFSGTDNLLSITNGGKIVANTLKTDAVESDTSNIMINGSASQLITTGPLTIGQNEVCPSLEPRLFHASLDYRTLPAPQ